MHPAEGDEARAGPEASEKVLELADRIIELNMLEVSSLTEVLKDRLGISGASGMMMMPGAGMMPGVGAPPAADGGAPAAAAEERKDDFAVKLTGYDAASKIKVIKEVRAMTDLGLKEAKEMVEKGEFVVKEGLGKEEAEGLVKKLQEAGAEVKME
jgi:large subunit ribosomal protein L7/L12